ncbi:DUF456 domain-containing protein [Paenisporosarcina cavernae]|uniref:DUF456 family protein n=1 Tax=Paenisporosarcina cavernae TaxID=2320858 RepID=A0A385YS19_9BACL|nr:DUF456 family protein [Paenisporosarcina cavernae]AYC29585.1 DUF456 family protein [Paenisporosarcina cavernae]
MEAVSWVFVIALFVIAYVGLIYPIIPSVLFVFLGFVVYGLFNGFSEMTWTFWVIELLFLILLFGADFFSNAFGIKRFGGSKAGIWGSTIGLLVGPFILPIIGIILGPLIGAILGELLVTRSSFKQSVKTGIGSLIGFLTSVITKGIVTSLMIVIFVWYV